MKNDYLSFYGENKISPVHQDISDIKLHYMRRQKLYRQCGIPIVAFRDSEALEIGPGGGYNTLALFYFGVKHVDLVEPNSAGVENMKRLFCQQNIEADKYTIIDKSVEAFQSEKKYDLIFAEGFLSYLENSREICQKLGSMLKPGGVITITCADDACIFVELMKRLIGIVIAGTEKTLSDKVNKLIPVFEPQLKMLKGVSRPAKDWIEDNIFNPAFSNGYSFSIGDALDVFEAFEVLGQSPRMLTDYSWYKDVWFDEYEDYKRQFCKKRMTLVMAGLPEQILNEEKSAELSELFSRAKRLENEYEKSQDAQLLEELSELLIKGKDTVSILNESFCSVYGEIVDAIDELKSGTAPELSKYPDFFGAFGRGLQYISFMKSFL